MLTVEGIQKSYEGSGLLCGVSFSVTAGETVCLLGPSGSGKSTLLRIIAGLELADAGRVLWQGEDVTRVAVHQRRFGLMFQDYALFPHRNVAQNIAFGLRMLHHPVAEIERKVAQALELVNLTGFEKRRVTDLSGGEQQRVALARALAPRPRLLMLDEPLGALDRGLREQLMHELRGILQVTKIPAIYVTHDQEEAFTIADRLFLLYDGVIQQSGNPQQVYQFPGSVWAAKFLGLTNLTAGEVVSTNPLEVNTCLGTWRCVSTSKAPAIGRKVTVLVRPTGAKRAFTAGDNRIVGRVVDCLFGGDVFWLDVLLSAQMVFRFNVAEAVAIGSEITLGVAAEDVLCLDDESNG